MERVVGRIERRVLAGLRHVALVFLRRRWIAALVWAVCLVGTFVLFHAVPKSFLPPGDSSVVYGVFIAARDRPGADARHPGPGRRGAALGSQRADGLHHDGERRLLPSNQGITFTFLKPAAVRGPMPSRRRS